MVSVSVLVGGGRLFRAFRACCTSLGQAAVYAALRQVGALLLLGELSTVYAWLTPRARNYAVVQQQADTAVHPTAGTEQMLPTRRALSDPPSPVARVTPCL